MTSSKKITSNTLELTDGHRAEQKCKNAPHLPYLLHIEHESKLFNPFLLVKGFLFVLFFCKLRLNFDLFMIAFFIVYSNFNDSLFKKQIDYCNFIIIYKCYMNSPFSDDFSYRDNQL